MFFVSTTIFVEKSVTYVDVVYLKYFINIYMIHKYNLRVSCLVYLYFKIDEVSQWKTRRVTKNNYIFMVTYLHVSY